MTNPLVSVIMPAYNAEKYIGDSIKSVIAQTYIYWELIIVDDGSTDTTAKIIKRFQAGESRIKYIHQPNARQGRAKTTAIKASNGEYLAFLDADDLWLPQKLQISLQKIQAGNYDLLFTNSYVFEDNPGNLDALAVIGACESIFKGKEGVMAFLESNKIPNLTVVVKKNAMIQAGDFIDSNVAEEYEMWLRLLSNGCVFKSIATPLSLYRMHPESITAKDRQATFEVIKIIKTFLKDHPEYRTRLALQSLINKIIYWITNGDQVSKSNFRQLIRDVYPEPVRLLLTALSWPFSLSLVTKISRKFSVLTYGS